MCSGSIARGSRRAGTDERAQSARKCRKQRQIRLVKGVSRRALHAITPSPAFLPFSRTLAFTRKRYFVADWMRVCVKGVDMRVCARGGE
eukprot:COSAG01_NODE_6638_length_3567_cov_62.489908_2_plen_89_part_00